MNLYRISQNVWTSYDTYDSAVVAAESEDAARRIHPSGDADRVWGEKDCTWVTRPEDVKVELIGLAAPFITAGVICASFNAG